MTWWQWAITSLASLSVLASCFVALLIVRAMRKELRADQSVEPIDPERFMQMGQRAKEGYLRHPSWPDRCSCGRFGMPWPDMGRVLADDQFLHGREVCQPVQEAILDS